MINRGYICYRASERVDGNSPEKGSSQLALITATRRGLTVRSRIMPIGVEPVGLSTWDRSRGSRSSTFDRINLPYYRQFGYVLAEILRIIVLARRKLIGIV